MIEKFYHIYAKDKCIYQRLPECDFRRTWDMLDKFLSITKVMEKSELRYEEISAPIDFL
jgi:hypothetical protein